MRTKNPVIQCSRCRVGFSDALFSKNERGPGGYQNVCKRCSRTYSADWYRRRREEPAFMERQRADVNDRDLRRSLKLYGLSREQFETLQARGCACCGVIREDVAKRFAFDHDHETGLFRGLLCAACNLGIGKLGDTRDGVLRAAAYLERTTPELIWDEMI